MNARVTVTFGDPVKLTNYEAATRAAGLQPVREPSLDGVGGLLLTGGADVDPEIFGEAPLPTTDVPDRNRDARELALLSQALRRRLPVLAICRGLQLLNVARGGTLIQHLPDTGLHRQPHVPDAHQIEIVPGSRLAAVLGPGPYTVNSRHHQAVGRTGAGLNITASAGDVVEALELDVPQFLLAVQWHPEARFATHPGDLAIFQTFARAVADAR